MDQSTSETSVKVVIGNLLETADPIAKSVLTAFQPFASRSANEALLNGSKFTVSTLESLANLLGISVVDGESKKLFTKPTLARRLTSAVFALFPSVCDECEDTYTVNLKPTSDCTPLLSCFMCYQGSHWCQTISDKVSGINLDQLPCGMIWLCNYCKDMNTPIKPRKGGDRSRCNSVSLSSRSRANSSAEEPEQGKSLKSKGESSDKSMGAGGSSDKSSGESSDKKSSDKPKGGSFSDGNKPVCRHFKKGMCVHGLRGNKVVDGKKCEYRHPKRCFKYMGFKTDKKKGCVKGSNCQYYHPPICPTSLKNRRCEDKDCKMPHLKSNRKHDGTSKEKSSDCENKVPQKVSQKTSQKPSPKSSSTYSDYKASFLEVKEMVEK